MDEANENGDGADDVDVCAEGAEAGLPKENGADGAGSGVGFAASACDASSLGAEVDDCVPLKMDGIGAALFSTLGGSGAGVVTAGGAMLTPGFAKIEEFAKKFGMDELGVDELAAGELVLSAGLAGVGLGGTSEIDGTGGNNGADDAATGTSGFFGEVGASGSTGADAFDDSPKKGCAGAGAGGGLGTAGLVNENGRAAMGGSLALLESCMIGAF